MKKAGSKGSRRKTPVRAALADSSPLQSLVHDGLGAVIKSHRGCFDQSIRNAFEDSLDLDAAMRKGNEQVHRWDYLLGHSPSQSVVAVEPHSAEQGEISVLISKCSNAKDQLRAHLREGVTVAQWLWVASGRVQFAATEKAERQLAQRGIQFVGTRVTAQHLPQSPRASSAHAAKQGRKHGK